MDVNMLPNRQDSALYQVLLVFDVVREWALVSFCAAAVQIVPVHGTRVRIMLEQPYPSIVVGQGISQLRIPNRPFLQELSYLTTSCNVYGVSSPNAYLQRTLEVGAAIGHNE